jgi:hypothetical protein
MLINRNVNIYDVNIFINMKIIITENQVDKIKSKIHEYVKKYGIEKCKEIFGEKVLLTIGFNNDPMEFLNLFNDLDVTQSVVDSDMTLFRNEKGENIIIYDSVIKQIFINSKKIWLFLQEDFSLGYSGTQYVISNWLSKNYNITDVMVFSSRYQPI